MGIGIRSARRRAAGLILAAALAAGPIMTGTDAASASPTTTVRGTVVSGPFPLASVRVGFWTTAGRVLGAARTDADGRFAIAVPRSARGFVYAGWRPDGYLAAFRVPSGAFVRGVIGAVRPAGAAAPFGVRAQAVTAGRLVQDGPVRFRLQRAGDVVGGDPRLAGLTDAVRVERLDGSPVQGVVADASGGFRSRPIVPGTYRVVLRPPSPWLDAVVDRVVVAPGRSTRIETAPIRRGAVLAGTVTSEGEPVAVPITVLAPDGSIAARGRSGDDGAYAIDRLVAGSYTVAFGTEYLAPSRPDPAPIVVPVRRDVEIGADLHDVVLDAAVGRGARISGTVTRPRGRAVVITAQTADGTGVAQAVASSAGDYTLIGLVPGTAYTLVAVSDDLRRLRFGTLPVVAEAGEQTVPDIDASAHAGLALTGPARGAEAVQAAGPFEPQPRTARVRAGRYRIEVAPGRYAVTALAKGRLHRTVRVRVDRSLTVAVPAGPRPARTVVTLRSPVPITAPSAAGIARPGGVLRRLSAGLDGRFRPLGRLGAGVYSVVPGSVTPPVSDGPWWFDVPAASFRLTSGRTVHTSVLPLRLMGG